MAKVRSFDSSAHCIYRRKTRTTGIWHVTALDASVPSYARGPNYCTVQYMWACHEWPECELGRRRQTCSKNGRSLTVTIITSHHLNH